ncbi:hypothetical protein L7F22_036754 [Adiantum nelumboides]|nr:hypothetical protein [Adiantum nelumboides]
MNPLLLYADDIVLISDFREGIQHHLDALHRFAHDSGLSNNLGKTKVMVFNTTPQCIKGSAPTFTYNHETMEYTNAYTYLGVVFVVLNVDFAGHPDCRKSTSRYVFTFTDGAVSWISRLQKCVALSTTEAEYVAAIKACKEALWLMRLVDDLGIKAKVPGLHCDSQSAIMLAKNPIFHAKRKHIEVKYHFIKSVLADKAIELVKVHTDDNSADLFTKGLPAKRFAYCRQLMGMV